MNRIDDLKKKLKAMKIKGSRSLTLDVSYIEDLVREIDAFSGSSDSTETTTVSKNEENKSNEKITIHGGSFK